MHEYTMMRENNRNGFTLVELSIAIVIVGLLIGGILVGQSLIASAKINKLGKEISQYDIAIDIFKSRHQSLPADYKNSNIYTNYSYCAGSGNGGNQDGHIEYRGSRGDYSRASEAECFWWVLYRSGILKNKELNGWHNDSNSRAPKFFGKQNYRIDFAVPWNTLDRNRYVLYDYSQSINNQRNNPGLTPSEAGTYDGKFDDGAYNSGRVISSEKWPPPPDLQKCILSSKYNYPNETRNCRFNIIHKDSKSY